MPKFARAIVMSVAVLLLPVGAQAASDTISSTPTHAVFSYETLKLSGGEHMGMMGGSLLYAQNRWLSLGPGFYGAMSGQRGGFITLGLSTQAQLPLTDRLALELGGYVGAGGGRGSRIMTGGGLYLRANAGVQYDLGGMGSISAGASYVSAPYGNIRSTQPYIAYQYGFNSWLAAGWQPQANSGDEYSYINPSEDEFALVYLDDIIPSSVRTDAGGKQGPMKQMGFEWNRYLTDHFYIHAETSAATGGQSNGYMQILLGGGYRLHLTKATALKLTLAAGPAGGGGVDTGGGLLLGGTLGLQHYFGETLYVEADGGYTRAPGRSFRAVTLSGQLGYRLGTPDTSDSSIDVLDLAAFPRRHLRMRFMHQVYMKANPQWRRSYADRNIDLLGFQGDYFLKKYLYLTGEAMAAYRGMAGSFMTGLFGAGVEYNVGDTPLFVDAEGLTGAAGGGGVAVTGGLVWQVDAHLGCRIGHAYSLMAGYGRMESIKGHFKANVLGIALTHRLTLFAM